MTGNSRIEIKLLKQPCEVVWDTFLPDIQKIKAPAYPFVLFAFARFDEKTNGLIC